MLGKAHEGCQEASIQGKEDMTAEERFNQYQDLAWSLLNRMGKASDEDYVQEAFFALWKAALNFEESRGLEFTTYAVPYITGTLKTYRHRDKLVPDKRVGRGEFKPFSYIDSLDRPLDEEGKDELGDMIPDKNLEDIEKTFDMRTAQESFTEREKKIWDLRIAGYSCPEIAAMIEVSTSTVEKDIKTAALKVWRKL